MTETEIRNHIDNLNQEISKSDIFVIEIKGVIQPTYMFMDGNHNKIIKILFNKETLGNYNFSRLLNNYAPIDLLRFFVEKYNDCLILLSNSGLKVIVNFDLGVIEHYYTIYHSNLDIWYYKKNNSRTFNVLLTQ